MRTCLQLFLLSLLVMPLQSVAQEIPGGLGEAFLGPFRLFSEQIGSACGGIA